MREICTSGLKRGAEPTGSAPTRLRKVFAFYCLGALPRRICDLVVALFLKTCRLLVFAEGCLHYERPSAF
jgi:hypothetical protein